MVGEILAFMPSMGMPELMILAILGLVALIAIAVVLVSVWVGTRKRNSPGVPQLPLPPVQSPNDDPPTDGQAT